ncbi:MAG TPA: hypothetical protein VFA91_09335 [Candidatus Polarisedimenticolia bacterium]|nr:hypothetical protein [Candidatus Polarisedimenticolia bacterium]
MAKVSPDNVNVTQGDAPPDGVVRKTLTLKDHHLTSTPKDPAVGNMPGGYSTVQLPIVLTRSQFFIGEAKAKNKIA